MDPRGLWGLRRRLLNQLDQKTGAEKRILRRTVAEIERRLRAAGREGASRRGGAGRREGGRGGPPRPGTGRVMRYT